METSTRWLSLKCLCGKSDYEKERGVIRLGCSVSDNWGHYCGQIDLKEAPNVVAGTWPTANKQPVYHCTTQCTPHLLDQFCAWLHSIHLIATFTLKSFDQMRYLPRYPVSTFIYYFQQYDKHMYCIFLSSIALHFYFLIWLLDHAERPLLTTCGEFLAISRVWLTSSITVSLTKLLLSLPIATKCSMKIS